MVKLNKEKQTKLQIEIIKVNKDYASLKDKLSYMQAELDHIEKTTVKNNSLDHKFDELDSKINGFNQRIA